MNQAYYYLFLICTTAAREGPSQSCARITISCIRNSGFGLPKSLPIWPQKGQRRRYVSEYISHQTDKHPSSKYRNQTQLCVAKYKADSSTCCPYPITSWSSGGLDLMQARTLALIGIPLLSKWCIDIKICFFWLCWPFISPTITWEQYSSISIFNVYFLNSVDHRKDIKFGQRGEVYFRAIFGRP